MDDVLEHIDDGYRTVTVVGGLGHDDDHGYTPDDDRMWMLIQTEDRSMADRPIWRLHAIAETDDKTDLYVTPFVEPFALDKLQRLNAEPRDVEYVTDLADRELLVVTEDGLITTE